MTTPARTAAGEAVPGVDVSAAERLLLEETHG
ncbi:hypothetical protein HNP73_000511 [Amaricoccus macauensis]|uniref:Uncharacterized protein n=1 Tax=Amaricoccus macauensis TaxID=57001 RepID=A0A840SIK1_9RHOB|nr:hypothetical protein [Amaricoccus macauensis]